ncbi:MAG: hypothetical protein JNM40_17520 [Myxococcales bacterium]|nr:hypothetical protein [Myxococcales bacterium]
MNRRAWGLAIIVLVVTVTVFFYRKRERALAELKVDPGPTMLARLQSDNSSLSLTGGAPLASSAGTAKRDGAVVVKGGWGGGLGQFGHKRAAESSPEGPMALSVAPDGSVLIVDQINRRIERYRDGKPLSTTPIGGDTVQDLALLPEGRLAVLDRFVDKGVQIYDSDGKLLNDVALFGQHELGSLTGVFADARGVYVEREHGLLLRITDASGNRVTGERELPGRPSRDGQLVIAAALLERQSGQFLVRAIDRVKGSSVWERVIQLPTPILHMVMLDSDRQGRIYAAAVTALEEQVPPYRLTDEALIAVQLGRDGTERGRLKLPPLHGSDESFRPVTVDDDGRLYVMRSSESGLTVTRYMF